VVVFSEQGEPAMKQMTDEQLVVTLKDLAKSERKATAEVIRYLEEVYRRSLHLKMGYTSLHTFCERELGHTSGSADRRIKAMGVMLDAPEATDLYVQGQVSLETLQMMQNHSRDQRLPKAEKKELLHQVTGLSFKQAKEIVQPERTYTIVLNEEEYRLLQQLKGRVGSSKLKDIYQAALKHIPEKKNEVVKDSRTRKTTQSQKRMLHTQQEKCAHPGCEKFLDLDTDHKLEWSEGGKTTLENLQLMCPGHNRLKSLPKVLPYLTPERSDRRT
jgi:hypothetical protein